MRTSALKYPTSDADHLIENNTDFSFASGNLKLAASGMREVIATPAIGGSNPDSTFQRAIAQAFERAARAGQRNPIVVGAIPFDPGEPSCLYVPEEMDWQEREPASGASAAAMPQLAGQRSVPDEAGFKHAVEHAIINFRLSDVRKAVLSVMRELTFADDIDVDAILANLRAQNHDGYQFRVPLPGGGALVGVSPELLIHKDKGKIVSNPLAGSAKRMADPEADRKNADRLAKSEKDHYEHRLVIEDIRARLQPICTELDIPERPSLIHTAALWHLSTRIEGRLHDPLCRTFRAWIVYRHGRLERRGRQWRMGRHHPLRHGEGQSCAPLCRGGDRGSLQPGFRMGRSTDQAWHHAACLRPFGLKQSLSMSLFLRIIRRRAASHCGLENCTRFYFKQNKS